MVNSNSGKNPKQNHHTLKHHPCKKGFWQKINSTIHQAEILKTKSNLRTSRIYSGVQTCWKGDFFNLLFTRWKKLEPFLNFFQKKFMVFKILFFTVHSVKTGQTGSKPVNREGRVESWPVLRVEGCNLDGIEVRGCKLD